jgi:predicted transcriptional regulator
MEKKPSKKPPAQSERLRALQIKQLVAQGERDIAEGRFLTHAQVGRKLLQRPRRRKR